jgi:hypothetical protein
MYVSPLNAMNLIGWVILVLNHKGFIFGSVLKNVSNFWLSIHISSFFPNYQIALKLTINNNGLPISPKKMFVKMLE